MNMENKNYIIKTGTKAGMTLEQLRKESIILLAIAANSYASGDRRLISDNASKTEASSYLSDLEWAGEVALTEKDNILLEKAKKLLCGKSNETIRDIARYGSPTKAIEKAARIIYCESEINITRTR